MNNRDFSALSEFNVEEIYNLLINNKKTLKWSIKDYENLENKILKLSAKGFDFDGVIEITYSSGLYKVDFYLKNYDYIRSILFIEKDKLVYGIYHTMKVEYFPINCDLIKN